VTTRTGQSHLFIGSRYYSFLFGWFGRTELCGDGRLIGVFYRPQAASIGMATSQDLDRMANELMELEKQTRPSA
jgi:hypothetical protein